MEAKLGAGNTEKELAEAPIPLSKRGPLAEVGVHHEDIDGCCTARVCTAVRWCGSRLLQCFGKDLTGFFSRSQTFCLQKKGLICSARLIENLDLHKQHPHGTRAGPTCCKPYTNDTQLHIMDRHFKTPENSISIHQSLLARRLDGCTNLLKHPPALRKCVRFRDTQNRTRYHHVQLCATMAYGLSTSGIRVELPSINFIHDP